MKEGKLGWAAGIIDGEGTIGIYKVRSTYKKKDGSVSEYINTKVVVAMQNTSEEMILELINIIGGGYYEVYPKMATKRTWRWWMRVGEAKSALPKLLPYLITKRTQALEVLEYFNK